jgi:hypothetical protein
VTASQPPIIADPEFGAMLPLSALLSQTLVAYTVEFDNEFEHQIPPAPRPAAGRAPAARG